MNKEKLTYKPKGWRDIYWCWYANEPMVLEYRDDEPYCVECQCKFKINKNGDGIFDKNWLGADHIFICHILKPFWHRTWNGKGKQVKEV